MIASTSSSRLGRSTRSPSRRVGEHHARVRSLPPCAAVRALFWIPAALLAWAQAGYGLFLAALRRAGRAGLDAAGSGRRPPAGDADRRRLQRGGGDRRQGRQRARARLAARPPRGDRGGRRRRRARTPTARPRAPARPAPTWCSSCRAAASTARRTPPSASASGELLAFSDANALWEPDALRHLAAAFADPEVGYACGQVRFVNEAGTNQEGLYWRYEMWLREHESALASVTAGNGAIYAVRPDAFLPIEGHDLAFPFNIVKRGRRAVYVPAARATEKMVPTVEGEWARKRRMMSHAWPIVVRGGLLDPRGYPPLYALMIALAPAAALRVAAAARGRRAGDARAAAPRPRVRRRRGARRRRRWRRPRGRPVARAAAAGRPLLRADDRGAGRRASTTGCGTAPRSAGRRRRARGEPRGAT